MMNDAPEFKFDESMTRDHGATADHYGVGNQFFQRRQEGENYSLSMREQDQLHRLGDLEERQREGLMELHEENPTMAEERREKMRYGGNQLPVKDISKGPYSGFYLLISGHIESGQVSDADGICTKYDFVAGPDWQVMEGNRSGISQHAYKSQQTSRRVVWNYPFELAFRGHNVSGWPQIVLTLTNRDFLGRDQVCGYGTVHIPTQPGTHTRYVNLFRPISSSLIS